MVKPLDDHNVLQQRVSRAAEDMAQLEHELDAAVAARVEAESDTARSSAVRLAATISGKLADAERRLSEAKRALAEAQGDTHVRDEATPTI